MIKQADIMGEDAEFELADDWVLRRRHSRRRAEDYGSQNGGAKRRYHVLFEAHAQIRLP